MTLAQAVDSAMGVGRIIVAVGAVIEDRSGSVLLVRHRPERKGFWQGRWICPGGKLELGEEIREGVLREVWEETRLEVELTEPLPPFERIVRDGDGTALHVIYIDYKARLAGGVLRPGGDVGEARWAARGEMPLLLPELHEDTAKLLRLAGVLPARAGRI
ncbi:MAG: NUDIX domain-containing protein [Dehalococcoidia bacterium]|nr:NUDIX domain-containing protein [Dehalococcoidia bacterium]